MENNLKNLQENIKKALVLANNHKDIPKYMIADLNTINSQFSNISEINSKLVHELKAKYDSNTK